MTLAEALTMLAIGLVVGAFGTVLVLFAFMERAVQRRRGDLTRDR